MTPEQFRQHGHEVVDWIADYWSRVGSLPVRSQVSPGEVRAALPAAAPEQGEPFSAVLADLDRVVLPGVTHWQHPGFFGYFPANTSGPVRARRPGLRRARRAGHVLGDQPGGHRARAARHGLARRPPRPAGVLPLRPAPAAASSRTPAPAPTWSPCSPPCTGPARAPRSGTASTPTGPRSTSRRRPTPRWRRPSASPGSAPTPSASWRSTATSPCARARSPRGSSGTSPAATRRCWSAPRSGRRRPRRSTRSPSSARSARSTASGCTSTPPTRGSAPSSRSCAALQAGVEWADSYTTDAHKWLLTGFDATLFWVADRAALTGALSILPEYLRNAATDAGAVVDFRDWQIPLGRRFRALKLWFVAPLVRRRGPARAHPRPRRPGPGAGRLGRRPTSGSTSSTPHPLVLVCLRPRWADDVDADVATMTLLERLNDGGEVFLTHTTVARPGGAPGGHRRPRHHPGARRAGLGAAARGPRLAGRRLRRPAAERERGGRASRARPARAAEEPRARRAGGGRGAAADEQPADERRGDAPADERAPTAVSPQRPDEALPGPPWRRACRRPPRSGRSRAPGPPEAAGLSVS